MKHGLIARLTGLLAVVSTVGIVGTIGGGGGPASAAPQVQPTFQGISPARLFESRPLPNNTVDGYYHPSAKVGPGSITNVKVVGRGGVPATGVGAVALNVTATSPDSQSYITVWPKGESQPLASNLNVVPGQTVANAVIAKVGADGEVSIFNERGSTDLIVDVTGWFPLGNAVQALTPARLFETRPLPSNTIDGEGHPGVKVGPGSVTNVKVLDRGGVPATGVEAVAVNVTVAEPDTTSYVTVWPAGDPQPLASNLNMTAGATVPALAVVRVGANGEISLFNEQGNTHLIVDVVAYFPTGDGIEGLVPARLFESRALPNTTVDGAFHPGAKVGPGSTTNVTVLGRGGVPATGVGAVALNVTVTQPEQQSYITVWPAGEAQPLASNLNMSPGATIANSVIVKVGQGGQVSLFNESGNTHLIVDVTAWFPEPTIEVPDTTTTTTTPPPPVQMQRVNLSSDPANAQSLPADAESPAISADGRYVAFTSAATNLTAGETGSDLDVFRRDLQTGETRKVSVRLACSGDPGCEGGTAEEPSISADGRYIAFHSTARNLDADDGDFVSDVYRADMSTTPPTIEVISVSTAEVKGNDASTFPSISHSGDRIAFISRADNLVTLASQGGADTNGHNDIFVRRVAAGETERVSLTDADTEATGGDPGIGGGSIDAHISGNGNYVAFTSDDFHVLPAVDGIRQVYRRSLGADADDPGVTELVTINTSGGEGGLAGIAGEASFDPSLSFDGRYVSFHSSASDLIDDDPSPGTAPSTPGGEDVYWRDMTGSTIYLVAALSFEPGDPLAANTMISSTGRYVTFSSMNAGLVTGDTNGDRDVFRADMADPADPVLVRVSVADGNVQANGDSFDPAISGDGERIVFLSDATNLVTGDSNGTIDVFVYTFE